VRLRPAGAAERKSDPLKTEQSRRSLVMPRAVTKGLAAWGAEQLAAEQLAGRPWAGTGLIFTDGFGMPVGRQKIHHGFRQACKGAGVARPDGRPFQPRELRYTFVSMLSDAGQDIEVISEAVGHINSGVTRTVYAHLIADKIQARDTVMDTEAEAP
jgi:integrase